MSDKQWGQCERKKPYPSPQAAANAARGRALSGVKNLSVYHCPYCQMYHLTKVKRRRF